ncbi:MAG: O-antigen ligase family protein [Clostridiaceae bacterium]|nr:O-antigen ligase family protein [Clostridiaceae bacterium]
MEGSLIFKTLFLIYTIIENSKIYKGAKQLTLSLTNVIYNSVFYRYISTDFHLFEKWRSSIIGSLFAKICSTVWYLMVKIIEAFKAVSSYSFMIQISNSIYKGLNSSKVIGYSLQALAIMLIAFGTSPLLNLLGIVYIIYISLYKIEKGIYTIAFLIPFISSTYLTLLVIGLLASFIINIRPVYAIKLEPYFLVFILFLALSVVTSPTRVDSLRTFMLYGSALLFAYILIYALDSPEKVVTLLKVNVLAAVIQSVYAALQYKFGIAMGGTWVDLEAFADITTRAMGTLGNPNVLAKYLVLIIIMGIIIVLVEKSYYKKFLYAFLNMIMLTGLVLTYSRGGWLALIFGIFLMAVLIDKRLLPVFGLGAVLVMALSPDIIIRRLTSAANLEDTSNAYRISIWIGTLELIRSHWLLGTGLGLAAFSQVYQYFVYGSAMAVHSHNLILQITAELGIFGLVTFFLLIGALVKGSLLAVKNTKDKRGKYFVYPLIAAIGAHLLHGFVDYVWYDPRILFTFWMVFGMLSCIVQQQQEV